MATSVAFQSAISWLAARIRRGKIGCQDLLELYLARTKQYNPAINAIIATDRKAARKARPAADAALAKGESGGRSTVPMTVKESFDVVGMPTTFGLTDLKDNYPKRKRAGCRALPRRGRGAVRKDQRAGHAGGLADFQSGLRHHQQSVGRLPGTRVAPPADPLRRSRLGSPRWKRAATLAPRSAIPAHYCGVYGHKSDLGHLLPEGPVAAGKIRDPGHHGDRTAGAQR